MSRPTHRIIVPEPKVPQGTRRRGPLEPGPDGGASDLTLYSSPSETQPGPRYFGPTGQQGRLARWWHRLLAPLRGRR